MFYYVIWNFIFYKGILFMIYKLVFLLDFFYEYNYG